MAMLLRNQLSDDQISSVDQLERWYTSGHAAQQPFVLAGAAGTGKTSILPVVLDDLCISTLDVVGLATSAIAAKNIGDKTGVLDVRTLASFLKAPQPQLKIKSKPMDVTVMDWAQLKRWLRYAAKRLSSAQQTAVRQFIQQTQINQGTNGVVNLTGIDTFALNQIFHHPYMFTLQTGFITRVSGDINSQKYDPKMIERLQTKQLIIVDEVSMIPDFDIETLLQLTKLANVAVLLIGDPFQLPPVKAKPCQYLLDAQYPYRVVLLKLHRQSNQIAQLGSLLRPPKSLTMRAALQFLREHGGLKSEILFATKARIKQVQRSGQVVKLLCQQDMVLTNTNWQVRYLTDLMRMYQNNWTYQQSQRSGLVVGDGIRIAMNELGDTKAGMVQPNERMMNGLLATITKIHDDTEVVKQLQKLDVKVAKLFTKVGLKCVDLTFADGRKRDHLFVNTVLLHDPTVNVLALQRKPSLTIDGATNDILTWYQRFNTVVLQNDQSPYFDSMYHHGSILYVTFGQVLTVHKAQGREWDNVVYFRGPAYGASSEQLRLDYTAVTRAKKQLTLLLNDK